MAADLHIHVVTANITDAHFQAFFSNVMGSKWYAPRTTTEQQGTWKLEDELSQTPHIWIGEVSWLKAGLLDDPETFIPAPVQAIANLIGEEQPVLDDELISKIMDAFKQPNSTTYTLAEPEEVKTFLEKYRGNKVFTVSW